MKLTNEQINALSDDQINEMMTRHLCKLHDGFKFVKRSEYSILEFDDGNNYTSAAVYDYCNDHAVMMSIAFEDGISLINTDGSGEYTACGVGTLVDGYCGDKRNDVYIDGDELSNTWRDKNPCRAAAIVYLKSNGAL